MAAMNTNATAPLFKSGHPSLPSSPKLSMLPSFQKLRLGFLKGRDAIRTNHRTLNGKRPEPAQMLRPPRCGQGRREAEEEWGGQRWEIRWVRNSKFHNMRTWGLKKRMSSLSCPVRVTGKEEIDAIDPDWNACGGWSHLCGHSAHSGSARELCGYQPSRNRDESGESGGLQVP